MVRSEASSMADGARIDGGSGIWKLTSRAPRTPSTFGYCRTTVAMATPRSPLQGGLRTRPLGTSSGELTDPPWRPGPDVSRCRSRSSRGTHSLLDSAVRECGESRVAPVQRASFRHYGRPTSPRMTRSRAWRTRTLRKYRLSDVAIASNDEDGCRDRSCVGRRAGSDESVERVTPHMCRHSRTALVKQSVSPPG